MPNSNTITVFRSGGAKLKHGHSTREYTTPTYQSWKHMLVRVRPNYFKARYYYDKGVIVCKQWYTFENFLADVGERPSLKHSIDRYPDKNGNYEPGNTRWATIEEQNRNHNRNFNVTFRGRTMCLKDWADELCITPVALKRRLRKWLLEEALTSPKGGRNPLKEIASRANGSATKLAEQDVRIIRTLIMEEQPYRKIAARYGISTTTVSMIATRKRWRHVI